jgi:hypothetical protein
MFCLAIGISWPPPPSPPPPYPPHLYGPNISQFKKHQASSTLQEILEETSYPNDVNNITNICFCSGISELGQKLLSSLSALIKK